jgi:hypothetical protein
MKFETPILFLIFNRPVTTKIVFKQIKEVKPKYLYIAADGPRENRLEEVILCQQTRDLIMYDIDWDCEVKTFFRGHNLGCGLAVSDAIAWFFENVEMGIILEDDCLPDISFFFFCDELLNRYKHNEKIVSICGTNILPNFFDIHSYIFSLYGGNWGWAAWRRSWELFDYKMDSWKNIKNQKIIRKNIQSKNEYLGIKKMFDLMISEKRLDTWDIQWFYSRLLNNKLSIVPTKNLVKNIGFGSFATHTFELDNQLNQLTINKIDFPLIHNKKIKPNRKFDRENSLRYGWYIKISYLKIFKNKLFNLAKRINDI